MKHFSESKNSMIQSAVNEYNLKKAKTKAQDLTMQAPLPHAKLAMLAAAPVPAATPEPPAATPPAKPQDPSMHVLNTVLESANNKHITDSPQASRLERVWAWVKHKGEQVEHFFTHSDLAEAYGILEEYVDALLAGDTELAAEKAKDLQESKYSEADPNWAQSMITWFYTYRINMSQPKYVQWNTLDDFVYPLPKPAGDTLKVGLIGDWGTGEPNAVQVLKQLFALEPDLIIHLGDIYYSGTLDEYEAKYHAVIEQARRDSKKFIPVYNLPGNHDYYSGGEGFYNSLATVNQTAQAGSPVQQASYFALFNDQWQIQGMDTGFHDNNVLEVERDLTYLEPKEVEWHQHQLDQAVAKRRKIILLSHHQLFSRYEAIGEKTYNEQLLGYFQKYIDQQQIGGWFWGHEHVAAIYKPTLGLAKGRCIGNSAVPLFFNTGVYEAMASFQGKPLDKLPEVEIDPATFSHDDTYYSQGFALLELGADQTATASYYTIAKPAPFYSEQLC